MDLGEALQRATAHYSEAATKGREAQVLAEQAREKAAQAQPDLDKAQKNLAKAEQEKKSLTQARKELREAEKPGKAAENAQKKANKAEKDAHMAQLTTLESHQPGEDKGCVTRCVREQRGPATGWRPGRAIFDGHDHKENAIRYHVANEAYWYNLRFHLEGSRERKRLLAATSWKYNSDDDRPASETEAEGKKRVETGRKRQLKMRLASREDRNNPLVTAGAWDMGLSGENFWSDGNKPWHHEAHHIIPTNALAEAFGVDMALLQQLTYNINRGINIIILPTQHKMGTVFLLPAHVNSHPGYSNTLEARIRAVRNDVGEQQEKQEGHPELSEAESKPWKARLENISKSLRKQLRKTGLREGLSGNDVTLDQVFAAAASA
ncbi:AHH domain-containing protein [Corallococcus sp. bb12-1]|uniref:AHH domain-containing protein n=1 Tax=Corallococcus sp. bb12-1 TaxID=2996784 RepID=UPI00226E5211|nr:AHH domain-containing protein [Corallococcus sp. bb12-1]MCY1046198.1 AHH domain-containing protein [Corallococcus sp. bb12-1]